MTSSTAITIYPALNRKIARTKRKRSVCWGSQVVTRAIKIPRTTIGAGRPRCRGVERTERLNGRVAVARDGEVVAAVVDEAVALTGQQRGVGNRGQRPRWNRYCGRCRIVC